MKKLNAGFSGYSADGLAHLGHAVAANLLLMAVFALLKPTPAEIETAAKNLDNAIALVVAAGRAEAIDASFAMLADLLTRVAVNAPQIAAATDEDLAKVGLDVAKTPVRSTSAPGISENLVLSHGPNPGEVLGRCNPPAGNIRLYNVQWTLDPNGVDWTDALDASSSRSIKLTGLPRGKDIWVRVRAINTIGPGVWSDPATIMVI